MPLLEPGAVEVRLVRHLAELVDDLDSGRLATAAIDIPVGLPLCGPRAADVEARRLLGPRRNSVFPAPARRVLGARTYEEACARSRAASGKAISRQLFNILPKILEADTVQSPSRQDRLVEMCPELSLTFISGAPMARPKSTAEGRVERMEALGSVFGSLRRGSSCGVPTGRRTGRRRARCLCRRVDRAPRRLGHAPATGGRARRARVADGGRGLNPGHNGPVPVALFDLDHTLYDREGTFRRWAAAYVAGRPDPAGEVEWLCQVDGDGMTDRAEMWTRVRRRYGLETPVPKLEARYRREYLDTLEPDRHVIRSLGLLRDAGWRIGVVTNGPTPHQARKADRLGLLSLVDGFCASGEVGFAKPDPRIFHEAIRRCGGPASDAETWMVGDSPQSDIGGARATRNPDRVDPPGTGLGSCVRRDSRPRRRIRPRGGRGLPADGLSGHAGRAGLAGHGRTAGRPLVPRLRRAAAAVARIRSASARRPPRAPAR